MPREITGIRLDDGEVHPIDYQSLANKPDYEIPEIDPTSDLGKLLMTTQSGANAIEWVDPADVVGIDVGSGNEGDVLTIYSGDPTWRRITSALLDESIDSYEADGEDYYSLVLHTASCNTIEWRRIVPPFDSGDMGKVLTITGTGNEVGLLWATPSGGGSDVPSTEFAGPGDVLRVSECQDNHLLWTSVLELPTWGSEDSGTSLVIAFDGSTYEPVWRSILPEYDTSSLSNSDYGKVLMVGEDAALEWQETGSLFDYDPDYDEFKVLMISDCHGVPEWFDIENVLHAPSQDGEGKSIMLDDSGHIWWDWIVPPHDSTDPSDDAGKVLTVASNGELVWRLPN